MLLGSFFNGFLLDFWLVFACKIIPKSMKNAIVFVNRFFTDFWWIFGWFWEPKSSKNPSPKPLKKSILFGSPLDRFLKDFGRILGPQKGRKLFHFWIPLGSWSRLGAKMPPRPLPEASRPLPEASRLRFCFNFHGFLLIFGQFSNHFYVIFGQLVDKIMHR